MRRVACEAHEERSRLAAVAAGVAAVWLVAGVARASPQPQVAEVPWHPCDVTLHRTIAPSVVLLGEQAAVTLLSTHACGDWLQPSAIMLVLDNSGSVYGRPAQQLRDAAARFIRRLDLDNNPQVRVGAVHFDHRIALTCMPVSGQAKALGCLRPPTGGGDTNLAGAINEATFALKQSVRAFEPPCIEPKLYMIVFSDGYQNFPVGTQCVPDVVNAARSAKSAGITVATTCVRNNPSHGQSCEEQCMRTAAHSSAWYRPVESFDQLSDAFARLAEMVAEPVTLGQLTVVEQLSEHLRFVPGSADPVPQAVSADGKTLRWVIPGSQLRNDDPLAAYRVQPTTPGRHTVGDGSTVDARSSDGCPVAASIAPDVVDALRPFPPSATPTAAPTATATPTPSPTATSTPSPTPSATATSTTTPTAEPTATATPSAVPTATPVPKPIYLPVTLHEVCAATRVHVDVALVLDMSTSMDRPLGGTTTKQAAAIEAAKRFVALLDLEPDDAGRSDRVAVVGFNARAWIELGLTRDAAALGGALDRLSAARAEFTRLDLGFASGLAALQPAIGTTDATPIIVLLTDGLPNRVPPDPGDGTMETTVRKAAQRAQDAGVRVYTIGIGERGEINAALMAQCATSPADYFYTATTETLADIYAGIARTIGCSNGRHAWDRPWP